MHALPMSRLCRAVATLRARAAQEQGFGLIELMVAVAIVLVSLLAVASTALMAPERLTDETALRATGG
jgi:prepilin-type N-terminal cleavage/methylation domain-containing protein